jgi:16S rRNA (uracil1498-N3)-methyltransferase
MELSFSTIWIKGRRMRFFYVEPSQMAGSKAVLEGAEAAHVKNVLRLRRGAAVGLVDGAGFEYTAVIDRIVPGRVELAVTGRQEAPGQAPVRICVAQGCLKEKKMDRVVRQLSELGAARWVPFICERAVARPESERAAFRRERWRKIAVESLKQCRRGNLMDIAEVTRFEEALKKGRSCAARIFFWEKASEPLTLDRAWGAAGTPPSVMVMLGPEGGFTEQEARAAEAAGFVVAGLGPRILRAETAAVAACALVQYIFGDLGPHQKNLDKE